MDAYALVGASPRPGIPARVVAARHLAAGLQRMAAIELEGSRVAVVLVVEPLAGERLNRGGRKLRQHLVQVRAAGDVAEARLHVPPEPARETQPDELPRVDRPDRVARPRIGHALGQRP